MIPETLFDSKFTVTDGVELNTRFNKNYVFNALIGEEWQVGKDKSRLLSAKEYDKDFYNINTSTVDAEYSSILVPNLG